VEQNGGNPFCVGKKIPEAWIDKLDNADYFHFMKFECGCVDNVSNAVFLFEKYVLPTLNTIELKGKNLSCFCNLENICHADLLLKIANENTLNVLSCTAKPK